MKFLVILCAFLTQQCLAQYGGQPNPYGAPAPAAGYGTPDETADEAAGAAEEPTTPSTTKSPFPLPDCYINNDGFLCCNRELEKLMSETYDNLSKTRNGQWKKCNREQVNIAIQAATEKHFEHKFELVTGAGAYASKNNFDSNLICKIKKEKSIILAYGTPTF